MAVAADAIAFVKVRHESGDLSVGDPGCGDIARKNWLSIRNAENCTLWSGPCAAQVSPLVKLLKKGHYEVKLSADDWDRLITWIDTYGQRRGAFSPSQENDPRELRRRMASMLDELPRQRAAVEK